MGYLRKYYFYQVETEDGWDVGFWDGHHWYFVDLNHEPATVQVLEVLAPIEKIRNAPNRISK